MSLEPHQTVVTSRSSSIFTCHSINSGALQQFQWLVNGTRLEDLNQTDGIEADLIHDIGALAFTDIPVEYNDTIIQCIVTFTSGQISTSNNATLLVQGEDDQSYYV